jgi:hypothetical protein
MEKNSLQGRGPGLVSGIGGRGANIEGLGGGGVEGWGDRLRRWAAGRCRSDASDRAAAGSEVRAGVGGGRHGGALGPGGDDAWWSAACHRRPTAALDSHRRSEVAVLGQRRRKAVE